jgi:virginiamycin A acetyltransferase
MKIDISIPEYSINDEYQYMAFLKDGDPDKTFPLFTIGRDSYIITSSLELNADPALVCNMHIGRYSSVAKGVSFMIDQNHDYRRVCQGRISGADYMRPTLIRRKGHLVIMNDCWIGEDAMIMSGVTIGNGAVVAAGAVVANDIAPFAIAAGNPAGVIGYRFSTEQINALQTIRWWNWSREKILSNRDLLYGDIDAFIDRHLAEAEEELGRVGYVEIPEIENVNKSRGRRYLYIPDFEQDYPTIDHVIDSYVRAFSDTDNELLLYIIEDELLEEKLDQLNKIFDRYKDKNCYVNLFAGRVADERGLFCRADAYITNRSKENVRRMDIADQYGLEIISGVDIPVFKEEKAVQHMIRI